MKHLLELFLSTSSTTIILYISTNSTRNGFANAPHRSLHYRRDRRPCQGIPVITSLINTGRYHCIILTRNPDSARAKSLLALGNVSLPTGTFADEAVLAQGFSAATAAFVNIDGFNTGEKTEMYWAIRCYELTLQCGVKHYVYGNLDYVAKKSGYAPKFRCGHFDGKGRVGEWILFQNQTNGGKMKASCLTAGPFIDMTVSSRTVISPTVEEGVVTWRVPLGDGTVNFTCLEDCGYYVFWLLEHPERSNGMDLEVGIAAISGVEWAAAFAKITGKPAQYIDISVEEYWTLDRDGIDVNLPAGFNADPKDASTMSFRTNFTGWWNTFKFEVLTRDYALLDEIHPGRVRSVEKWFEKEDAKWKAETKGGLWEMVQKGYMKPILKIGEDGWKGTL